MEKQINYVLNYKRMKSLTSNNPCFRFWKITMKRYVSFINTKYGDETTTTNPSPFSNLNFKKCG